MIVSVGILMDHMVRIAMVVLCVALETVKKNVVQGLETQCIKLVQVKLK